MTAVFEIPVAYKLGAAAGSTSMLLIAQIADLLPTEPSEFISQGVFVGTVLWASRLIIRTVRQAQVEIVSAKDKRIAELEARIEFLTEQLAQSEKPKKKE